MSRRTAVVALTVALASACAASYKPPTISYAPEASAVSRPADEVFRAAVRAVTEDGYQVTLADPAQGLISTAPKSLRVTPEEADCGTTMGLDYLKDNRTATRAGFNIMVSERGLLVRATIEGEYRPGDVLQNITLACVSRGVLERKMRTSIEQRL